MARDSNEVWLFGFAGHIGVTNSLHAELLGLLHGLEVCWDRGYRKVEVFTDSQVALGLITAEHSPFHRYGALLNRVKGLL